MIESLQPTNFSDTHTSCIGTVQQNWVHCGTLNTAFQLHWNSRPAPQVVWVHRCGAELSAIFEWPKPPVADCNMGNLSSTQWKWRRIPGAPIAFSIAKRDTDQKQPVVGTNLVETVTAVGRIDWDSTSASNVKFCLSKTANLGVEVNGDDHNVCWTHASSGQKSWWNSSLISEELQLVGA